jgi:hypothetical protein
MLNSAQQNIKKKKPTLLSLISASISNLKCGLFYTPTEERSYLGSIFYIVLSVICFLAIMTL